MHLDLLYVKESIKVPKDRANLPSDRIGPDIQIK